MTWTRGVGSIPALALAASFLLARIHPFGNADMYGATAPQALIPTNSSIPPEVRTLLANKCADCHSAQPHAPFYGHFAPISWLMERDIVSARKAMNLSHWDSFSTDQQQTFRSKIVEETKTHEMPLIQYRMIHRNATITSADIQTLTGWAHNSATGTANTTAQVTSIGDADRGQALFGKRCTGCHALAQSHEGPRLQGIYGRATGSVQGFAYSDALKKANIVWNDQSLDKWLSDPDAFLPGNSMDFLVAKPQERKDLIAYFKKSAGD